MDENTIGVVGILGVTYTGDYEPIAEPAEGPTIFFRSAPASDIPLHVDRASWHGRQYSWSPTWSGTSG